MDSIPGYWKQVFTKFLDWKFLLFVLLIFAVESLITVFLFGLFAGAGFVLGLEFLLEGSLSALAVLIVYGIILFIAFMLVSVFFSGLGLFAAREFLSKGNFSVSKAFEGTKKRFIPSFAQQVLVSVIIFVFALIVFSPVIASALNFLHSAESQEVLSLALMNPELEATSQALTSLLAGFFLQNALFLLLGFLLCLLAFLAFIPALLLLKQAVFFESNSAIASIKRAINLGFKNFFKNWAFFILFIIVILVVSAVLNLIVISISASQDIAILAVSMLITLILQVFITATTMLFLVKLYDLNAGGKPEAKPFSEKALPLIPAMPKRPFRKTPVVKRKK
jgi:hypothetical protein